MPFWLPWISAVLLFLGVYIVSRRGFRRVIFGTTVSFLGGLGLWLYHGDPRTIPRELVLISSAGSAEKKPFQDLLRTLKNSKNSRKVETAVLLVDPAQGHPQATTWGPLNKYEFRKQAGYAFLGKETWPEDFMKAISQTIQGQNRPTIAFFLEGFDDPAFEALSLESGISKLLKGFENVNAEARPLDVLSIEAEAVEAAPLFLDLSRNRFAPHPISQLSASLTIRVTLPKGTEWHGANGLATVYYLNAAGSSVTASQSISWPKNLPPAELTLHFKGFTPKDGDIPGVGFHFVEIVLDTPKEAGSLRFSGGIYFEITSGRLRIVKPPTGAGRLADEGWSAEEDTGPPPLPSELWESYLADKERDWRQDILGGPEEQNWDSFLESVKSDPGRFAPGITLLIEPKQADLNQLGDSTNFPDLRVSPRFKTV